MAGSFLAASGLIARFTEGTPRPELPQLAEDGLNSWGHPMFGFAVVMAGRRLGVEKLSRARAAAAYLIGTTVVDVTAELTQDTLWPQPHEFLGGSRQPEDIRDFAFALGGMGVAMLMNRRRNEA